MLMNGDEPWFFSQVCSNKRLAGNRREIRRLRVVLGVLCDMPLSDDESFLPRDAMHPRYQPWACVRPCPCLSQAGVLLKRQNLGSLKQHHTWQLARFQLTRRIARSLGDSWASCVFYDGPPSTQRKRDVMLSTCFISSTLLFGSDHLCRPKRKHSKFENHIFLGEAIMLYVQYLWCDIFWKLE